MNAFIFPGQGAQLLEWDMMLSRALRKSIFLRKLMRYFFSLSKIMFHGSEDELNRQRLHNQLYFYINC